jgi:hypothetical protein
MDVTRYPSENRHDEAQCCKTAMQKKPKPQIGRGAPKQMSLFSEDLINGI